jgi:hypothetical protein
MATEGTEQIYGLSALTVRYNMLPYDHGNFDKRFPG